MATYPPPNGAEGHPEGGPPLGQLLSLHLAGQGNARLIPQRLGRGGEVEVEVLLEKELKRGGRYVQHDGEPMVVAQAGIGLRNSRNTFRGSLKLILKPFNI